MAKITITAQTKKDEKTNLYSYKVINEDDKVLHRSTPKYATKEEALDSFLNALKNGMSLPEPEIKKAKKTAKPKETKPDTKSDAKPEAKS